jgi:hypothetical protein
MRGKRLQIIAWSTGATAGILSMLPVIAAIAAFPGMALFAQQFRADPQMQLAVAGYACCLVLGVSLTTHGIILLLTGARSS